MLRRPPFNARADHAGERERKLAMPLALLLRRILHTNHEGRQGLPLQLPASHWLLRGSDWGTEGLVRWRLAGLPRLELSYLDLSLLQGRTHVQVPCQSERLQR